MLCQFNRPHATVHRSVMFNVAKLLGEVLKFGESSASVGLTAGFQPAQSRTQI
jgi:hypothetical protein